jgi:type VI secretion system protein VasI
MSVRNASIIFLMLGSLPAQGEVLLVCAFPTLPDVVIQYPDNPMAEKTLQVGSRPPVAFVEGQGVGRIISATVDDYLFQISPENSSMDVLQEGVAQKSEQGDCVSVGGPINNLPLELAGAEPEKPGTASEPAVSPGRWKVAEDKSAFDDSRTVVLSIESNESVRGQFGGPGPAIMYIRCMENTTSAYLWINDLFLSDIQGFGVVDYRIDDRKASKMRSESSTDNKALGLWSGGSAIPFIKEMLDGNRIALRATPFNESPVEFTFDLAGLDSAVRPLREACGW